MVCSVTPISFISTKVNKTRSSWKIYISFRTIGVRSHCCSPAKVHVTGGSSACALKRNPQDMRKTREEILDICGKNAKNNFFLQCPSFSTGRRGSRDERNFLEPLLEYPKSGNNLIFFMTRICLSWQSASFSDIIVQSPSYRQPWFLKWKLFPTKTVAPCPFPFQIP